MMKEIVTPTMPENNGFFKILKSKRILPNHSLSLSFPTPYLLRFHGVPSISLYLSRCMILLIKVYSLYDPGKPNEFVFGLAVFKPSQPLAPSLTHLKSGGYEVTWIEPESNGAPIIRYTLEYR